MKIIHVSDTHLIASGGTVGRCDPLDNFRAFVRHVNDSHADAAMCVITGDLVHAGEIGAYRLLREELANLRVPVRLLLGNHDSRENFAAIFPEVPRDEHGFVQSISDTEVGRFIFLDTNEAQTPLGYFCYRRQRWLEARLAEGESPVYLFLHHPPTSLGVAAVDDIRLQDEKWFGGFLARNRHRVGHIFFGHTHLNVAGSVRGVPFSCPRSTNHQTHANFGRGDVLQACTLGPTYSVVMFSNQSVICHFIEYRYEGPVWEVGSYSAGYVGNG